MLTLTYGYKKPESGDTGASLFTDLAADIQQTNDHTHNGTNSALLTSSSLTVTTQSIASGSWSAVGNGTFKQTISMTGGLQFDNVNVSFRISSSGNPLFLTVEKVSGTSYDVYINDNSLTLTAFYGL